MQKRTKPLLWTVVAFAVFVTALWQQRGDHAPPVVREASSIDRSVPAPERAQLLETLALIDRGGPFPYAKDGSVFSNREGRLPSRPRGYYREYTVPTPAAGNRGARRIVRGKSGDTWYTRDHYRTFVRIDR